MSASKHLNGNRRTIESGSLPVVGSDEYHRELTLNRRSRRKGINAISSGEDCSYEEEPTLPGGTFTRPPTRSLSNGTLKEQFSQSWEETPVKLVGAITALVVSLGGVIVSILGALH